MTEPVEGQPTADPIPAAPAPAAPAASPSDKPEWLTPEVEAWANQRVSGAQSSLQAQVNAARQQAEAAAAQAAEYASQLKIASMTEEEREQQAWGEAEEYVEGLERFRDMAELAEQFPDVAPHLKAIYSAQTADEIAQYLMSLLHPEAPEASDQVPPVDPNNPPAQSAGDLTGAFMTRDGQALTKDMRQKILSDLSAGGKSLSDILSGR